MRFLVGVPTRKLPNADVIKALEREMDSIGMTTQRVHFEVGANYSQPRNDICERALHEGYDGVWLNDDDIEIRPGTFRAVMESGGDVVTVPCLNRRINGALLNHQWMDTTEYDPKKRINREGRGELHFISLASGFMSRVVLEALSKPIFPLNKPGQDYGGDWNLTDQLLNVHKDRFNIVVLGDYPAIHWQATHIKGWPRNTRITESVGCLGPHEFESDPMEPMGRFVIERQNGQSKTTTN